MSKIKNIRIGDVLTNIGLHKNLHYFLITEIFEDRIICLKYRRQRDVGPFYAQEYYAIRVNKNYNDLQYYENNGQFETFQLLYL